MGRARRRYAFIPAASACTGWVRRVQAAIRQIPNHWKRVEVWLAPKLADGVKRMARQALADWRRRKAAARAPDQDRSVREWLTPGGKGHLSREV